MKLTPKIDECVGIQGYLQAVLQAKRSKNPRFSLRALAKRMGYRNPSLLSDVMLGRRTASNDFVQRLTVAEGLSEQESRRLTQFVKAKPVSRLPLDRFRFIADWYHLTLLEMILLKGFSSEPQALAKRLFRPLTKATIAGAWARLERLGLIECNANGTYRRGPEATHLFIGEGVSDSAIRLHHLQMIELATNAMESQPVNERDISGSTVALRKADLPRLRTAIYELHRLINELTAPQGAADAVYRMNIQLFRLDKEEQ